MRRQLAQRPLRGRGRAGRGGEGPKRKGDRDDEDPAAPGLLLYAIAAIHERSFLPDRVQPRARAVMPALDGEFGPRICVGLIGY
jgi:hypothetical protein